MLEMGWAKGKRGSHSGGGKKKGNHIKGGDLPKVIWPIEK